MFENEYPPYASELPAMALWPWKDRWSLRTGTYLDELPRVEIAIAEMKAAGL